MNRDTALPTFRLMPGVLLAQAHPQTPSSVTLDSPALQTWARRGVRGHPAAVVRPGPPEVFRRWPAPPRRYTPHPPVAVAARQAVARRHAARRRAAWRTRGQPLGPGG